MIRSVCASSLVIGSRWKTKFEWPSRPNHGSQRQVPKAIEYAEQRDFHAVLGYCASSLVALALVSDFPPSFFAGDIRVTCTGTGKERVELVWEPKYRVDVEKRWSFSSR